ncbi:MAG TPA: GNAT family protein [Sphingomonas sp.]
MIFGTSIAIGPILPVDIAALFRWSDDIAATLCNEPYRPPDWHAHEQFWTSAASDPTRVFFAIRARGATDIIGFVQIGRIEPIHRSATIGLRIGDAAHRRKGHGREALQLAVAYCWRQLNLSRIALSVFAHNEAAIALYAATGFEREGVLRRAVFIDGAWVDVVQMALCRPDRLTEPAATPPDPAIRSVPIPRR